MLQEKPDLLGTEFEVRSRVGGSFCLRLEELHPPYAMRFRFFGGVFEGPGGFLLEPRDDVTRVRYDIDVFARGTTTAALSQFIPLDMLQRFHMRRLLRSLAKRVRREQQAMRAEAHVEASPGLLARFQLWLRGPLRSADSQTASLPEIASPASPPSSGDEHFGAARQYLDALWSPGPTAEMSSLVADTFTREVFPHRFLNSAETIDVDRALALHNSERQLFAGRSYEVSSLTGGGSQVAIEATWRASVGKDEPPYGSVQEIEARVALFLKFENGRIVRERVYTCFEPWSDANGRAELLAERDGRPRPAATTVPEARPRPAGSNFEIARSYFAALNARAQPDEIAAFFAEDAVQEEFPNRFAPKGAVRSLAEIRSARETALELFDWEEHELRGATGSGATVALEVRWTARVAVTRDSFTAGQQLEAHMAVFLEFRDGLIVRQRTYRCFEASGPVTS
jgi:ketosteroid isomerase-like protein